MAFRNYDRPEHDAKQDEAERQDEYEDDWQPRVADADEVHAAG